MREAAARFQEEPLFDSGFDAVSCVDTVNPRSQLAWPVAAVLQDRRFPYFGSAWTYASLACATWPGYDSDRYLGAVHQADGEAAAGGRHPVRPGDPLPGARSRWPGPSRAPGCCR